MAKGQYLNPYQKSIVSRFYTHRDTTLRQKLAELVTEIYLATGEKALLKLWKAAEETMLKAGADAPDVERIVGGRRIAELAGLVSELQSTPPAAKRAAAKPVDDFD